MQQNLKKEHIKNAVTQGKAVEAKLKIVPSAKDVQFKYYLLFKVFYV